MKKLRNILLCLLLILSGCSGTKENAEVNEMGCTVGSSKSLKVYEQYTQIAPNLGFDTFVQLTAYVEKVSDFNEYWTIVKENWEYYDKLFDKYDSFDGVNNIKTINDNAGIAPVKVDDDLMEMILLSKKYYEITDGAFDITMGPVLEIWHNYREEGEALNKDGKDGRLPTQTELDEAAKYVGWNYVEIDEANQTVYLTDKNASLDVGGVAKGFAAEKIALKLECAGMVSGLVNAGGNIRAIGSNPNGEAWSVGITNPNDYTNPLSYEAIYYKESMSFVTSGDYLRYYTVGDVMYNHIISPYTLWPANNFRSVSINIKNSALADIYSTSLFIQDYETGLKLSEEQGFDALWVVDIEDAFEAEYSEIIDYDEKVKGIQLVANESAVSHTGKLKNNY
ncbi:MAG: FAD:protein FMN transferase [Erysipelotrichales bacterium]|nr:FAD:protein FMN transferase [Erysipelotrichales bacterium]